MVKKDKNNDILSNLKGFVRKGAASNSKSNIPTGHFPLDFVIHYGRLPDKVDLSTLEEYDPSKPLGLPLGKLVEIFGEEGGGKSSLAYRVVGFAQKMGYTCAWIDTENSFSDDLALINGVDADSIYYSDMSNKEDIDCTFFAEDVFDAIVELIRSGVKLIVLDSVANLVPKERMEADAAKRTIGIVARLMSENLGKIVNYAGKYGACVIFINQLREKIGVMFGCFHGDTLVSFADGKRISISKVVKEKMEGPILSYNKEKEIFEEKKIVNWFNNGKLIEDEEWLSFLTSGPGTKNGRLGFTCTPGHILYLSNGNEIKAEDVIVGDELLTYNESKVLLDEAHRDVIFGSLLGDGSIYLRNENTACFSLMNSEQPKYLQWKLSMLPMLKMKNIKVNNYTQERWDSKYSVELKLLKDMFYVNGSGYRQIPEDLLLSPLMAAIWYMDDGSLKEEGNRKTSVPIISIKRLRNNEEQINRAISLLESLDRRLVDSVSYQKSGCFLAISAKKANVFFSIIKQYIIEDMSYKLPMDYRQYCYFPKYSTYLCSPVIYDPILVPYKAKVLEKQIASKRKYRQKNKYDIEIEGNSNYLVGGGTGVVVHNSPMTTPGGRSLKHNASLRIEISKTSGADANIFIEDQEGNDVLIGRNARVNIRKNRMGKPFSEGIIIPIFYEPYFPDIEEKLFEVGRQLKVISVRLGVFKWIENDDDGRKEYASEGRKAFIDYLRDNNLAFLLATRVCKKAKDDGVFLPPEILQWMMQQEKQEKKEKKVKSRNEVSTKNKSPRGREKKNSSTGNTVSNG